MIQKIYLVPGTDGRSTFELKRLRDAIESLAGINKLREGRDSVDPEGTLFECELDTGENEIMPIQIHVSKDLGSVSLGAYHERGLSAAMEIQKQYGGEIYAFSEESSPDVVPLSTIRSPQELEQQLKLW